MQQLTFCLMILFAGFTSSCNNAENHSQQLVSIPTIKVLDSSRKKLRDSSVRTVHVFVALCDNKYQGIVPVGKIIGNGQDADNNLYWGCDYGLRTYFKKKTSDWILLESKKKVSATILEQLFFKHKTENVYLLADAYDGQFIKQTTIDFLKSAAGKNQVEKIHNKDTIYFGGASDVLAYIGHDGLMDFRLPLEEKSDDTTKRETIILACYSRNFFAPHLKQTNASPLVWTTGLMAPEAYTLHDALREWVYKRSSFQVREAAANAYSKYQKCSKKAAMNLLVSGW